MTKFNIYTEDDQGRDLFVSSHKTLNLAVDAQLKLETKNPTYGFETRKQKAI